MYLILFELQVSRLLEPVIFDAAKLSIDFMDSKSPDDVAYPGQLMPRHYTLTHHDVTAELRLSIGSSLNSKQASLFILLKKIWSPCYAYD